MLIVACCRNEEGSVKLCKQKSPQTIKKKSIDTDRRRKELFFAELLPFYSITQILDVIVQKYL